LLESALISILGIIFSIMRVSSDVGRRAGLPAQVVSGTLEVFTTEWTDVFAEPQLHSGPGPGLYRCSRALCWR
jgi:hypothetical protein